jgi:hypothetical protein
MEAVEGDLAKAKALSLRILNDRPQAAYVEVWDEAVLHERFARPDIALGLSEYRIYFLGADGHITRAVDVEASNDEAAIAVLRQHDHPFAKELWERTRVVCRENGAAPDAADHSRD